MDELKGTFISSLKRNNKQIRDDRATAIAEEAELIYKRQVEDIEVVLKSLKRERDNMLDMSPDNALSLKPAKDFDARDFVQRDIDLGVKIRNTEIQLEIAQRQYKVLFVGDTINGGD